MSGHHPPDWETLERTVLLPQQRRRDDRAATDMPHLICTEARVLSYPTDAAHVKRHRYEAALLVVMRAGRALAEPVRVLTMTAESALPLWRKMPLVREHQAGTFSGGRTIEDVLVALEADAGSVLVLAHAYVHRSQWIAGLS